MRTVFSNNSALAAAWVANQQSEGRTGAMFFDGARIYSYGYHYVIAHRLPNGVVLVSNRRYSNTTSRHTSEVCSALEGKYVSVYDADSTDAFNRNAAISDLDALVKKASKARKHGDFHRERAADIVRDTNAYLDAIESTLPRLVVPMSADALADFDARR